MKEEIRGADEEGRRKKEEERGALSENQRKGKTLCRRRGAVTGKKGSWTRSDRREQGTGQGGSISRGIGRWGECLRRRGGKGVGRGEEDIRVWSWLGAAACKSASLCFPSQANGRKEEREGKKEILSYVLSRTRATRATRRLSGETRLQQPFLLPLLDLAVAAGHGAD